MSNEQIKSQREPKTEGVQCNKGGGGEKEKRVGERGRGKVISQIWCLSLMTLDPHGREGKQSSVREMMNPKTDNLQPRHSQPTHTEKKKKTSEMNCSAFVSTRKPNQHISLHLLLTAPAFLFFCHSLVKFRTISCQLNRPTSPPVPTVDNMSGRL